MTSSSKEATDAAAAIAAAAVPLVDERSEQKILSFIGNASLVLLGEASHGTHDFYALRARITRALIQDKGFSAVAIEGDWPDAYAVNRFVKGESEATDAAEALRGFERFPTWMWRNTAVANFVTWLRDFNAPIRDARQRVGFYGLDLYSLHASMRAVVAYLEARDPKAAQAARASYSCFEDFGADTDHYSWVTGAMGEESCEQAVARELEALLSKRAELVRPGAAADSDEFFFATQNARVATNAERYYRTMNHGRVASWNLRDRHMAETLEELRRHLHARGQPQRIVVWAHNSHLGDARATEMGESGELNLGQLVREQHGDAARLIGLTTHTGTVMAATDWGEPGRIRRVRHSMHGSVERLFHDTGLPGFFLPLRSGTREYALLVEPRLERAIGVIYRPGTERISHYFDARVAEQFDAIIHLDQTRAVEPLEGQAVWDPTEAPETYPSGV